MGDALGNAALASSTYEGRVSELNGEAEHMRGTKRLRCASYNSGTLDMEPALSRTGEGASTSSAVRSMPAGGVENPTSSESGRGDAVAELPVLMSSAEEDRSGNFPLSSSASSVPTLRLSLPLSPASSRSSSVSRQSAAISTLSYAQSLGEGGAWQAWTPRMLESNAIEVESAYSRRHRLSRDLQHKRVVEATARELSVLRSELEACRKQNDALKEEAKCLQADNIVLVSQLDEQTTSLAALAFDAERYKACLDEHHVEVPAALYAEVVASSKIPTLDGHRGGLAKEALDAVDLGEDEKANFSSIHALVNTVNELQVRLREAHLRRASAADERVAELQALVSAVEAQLLEAQKAREALEHRHQQELALATKQRDAATVRLAALEADVDRMAGELVAAKEQERLKIEELKVNDLEQKVDTLQEVIEARTAELVALRAMNNSVMSSELIAKKENDYYATTLAHEREKNESLRKERDALYDDLHATRSSLTQASTEVDLVRKQLDLNERLLKAKDTELHQWKKRISDVQEEQATQQAFLDKALQGALSRLSGTEVQLAATKARLSHGEEELMEKEARLADIVREKDGEIARLTKQCESLQETITADSVSRAAQHKRLQELEDALETTQRERRILVDQVERVECQAALLRERHPHLDFEVLEEELQRFEDERLSIQAQLKDAEAKVDELERQLKTTSDVGTLAQKTVKAQSEELESQKQQIASLSAEKARSESDSRGLAKEVEELTAQLDSRQKELQGLQEKLEKSREALEEKDAEFKTLQLQFESEKAAGQKQLEDLKARLHLEGLDLESARQGHRLAVQAHSRDVERLETMAKELEEFHATRNAKAMEHKETLTKLQTEINSLKQKLEDMKMQKQAAEAERDNAVKDNEAVRRLLRERLDNLELSSDSVQLQLVQRLQTEDVLKKELDAARVSNERLRLDLRASETTVTKLREQLDKSAATIDQLEIDCQLLRSIDGSEEVVRRERELAQVQLRLNRITEDHKHQTELRHHAEKRLNDLLIETEPLRRRDALLQGELLSLKNSLAYAEGDAQLYKSKFFAATKGLESALASQKEEFSTRIAAAEAEANDLKKKNGVLQVRLNEIVTSRDQLKADGDKAAKEAHQFRTRVTQLQGELQSLRAQVAKQQQAPTTAKPDNSEIQKRYQVQLSNLQRLLQKVNGERDEIKAELETTRKTLQSRQTEMRALQMECQALQKKLEVQPPLVTESTEKPLNDNIAQESVSETTAVSSQIRDFLPLMTDEKQVLNVLYDMIDEAVVVGLMSSLVLKKKDLTTGTQNAHENTPVVQGQSAPAVGSSQAAPPCSAVQDAHVLGTGPSERSPSTTLPIAVSDTHPGLVKDVVVTGNQSLLPSVIDDDPELEVVDEYGTDANFGGLQKLDKPSSVPMPNGTVPLSVTDFRGGRRAEKRSAKGRQLTKNNVPTGNAHSLQESCVPGEPVEVLDASLLTLPVDVKNTIPPSEISRASSMNGGEELLRNNLPFHGRHISQTLSREPLSTGSAPLLALGPTANGEAAISSVASASLEGGQGDFLPQRSTASAQQSGLLEKQQQANLVVGATASHALSKEGDSSNSSHSNASPVLEVNGFVKFGTMLSQEAEPVNKRDGPVPERPNLDAAVAGPNSKDTEPSPEGSAQRVLETQGEQPQQHPTEHTDNEQSPVSFPHCSVYVNLDDEMPPQVNGAPSSVVAESHS